MAALQHGTSLPALPRPVQWHKVVLCDISRSGVRFLHSEQIRPTEQMLLVMPDFKRRYVEIVRCRRLGDRYFEIGARFVKCLRLLPSGEEPAGCGCAWGHGTGRDASDSGRSRETQVSGDAGKTESGTRSSRDSPDPLPSHPRGDGWMPELPEVETMRRGALPVVGGRITGIRRPACRLHPILVSPGMPTFQRHVVGTHIRQLDRLGKRLLVWLDTDRAMVFEPRMTGLVLLSDPPSHEHLRFRVDLQGAPRRAFVVLGSPWSQGRSGSWIVGKWSNSWARRVWALTRWVWMPSN